MENIPDSPEGILLESLLEGMNQYYSEELSQKTRRGQKETRLKGLHCAGKLNYGYYTEKKKVFIHDTIYPAGSVQTPIKPSPSVSGYGINAENIKTLFLFVIRYK